MAKMSRLASGRGELSREEEVELSVVGVRAELEEAGFMARALWTGPFQ